MTQPNPFAPQVPAAETQAPPAAAAPAAASVNPFAAPAATPAPAYAPPAAPAGPGLNGYYAQPAPAQPAYAPAPTAPLTPPANTYVPPALDPSGLASAPPPPPGGGRGADLKAMYGRLVLCFPQHIETVPRNPQYITEAQRQAGNTTQERMTVTVVVLDDGQGGMAPIAFGGDMTALPPKPHTESAPLPYVRKGMWINQSRMIAQLRPFLPATPGGRPGMTVGRVAKTGPAHNDPWYLIGAAEHEVARAQQYLAAVQAGHVPHPLAP